MNVLKMELLELAANMPDSQLAGAVTDLQRRSTLAAEQAHEDDDVFSWIGMIKNGPTNASDPERIDAVLAQGFGRR